MHVELTFVLHLVKVGQLGGGMYGTGRLQCANYGIHEQDVGQCLLDVLRVLGQKRACVSPVHSLDGEWVRSWELGSRHLLLGVTINPDC